MVRNSEEVSKVMAEDEKCGRRELVNLVELELFLMGIYL